MMISYKFVSIGQKPMKNLIYILLIFLCACASSPKRDDYIQHISNDGEIDLVKPMRVYLNPDQKVDFRGVYDFDSNIDYGPVTYVGDAGMGGVAVQLLAQALITSSAQEKKLADQQASADRVLEPYLYMLDGFQQTDLVHDHDKYFFDVLPSDPEDEDKGLVLQSLPIFFMSQNEREISLKHIVSVYAEDRETVLYRNLIEVVHEPIELEEPIDYFILNDGENLKYYSNSMFRHSLAMVVADVLNEYDNDGLEAKSIRFTQNDASRFERGWEIGRDHEKVTIRNLRGWLISYPVSSEFSR